MIETLVSKVLDGDCKRNATTKGDIMPMELTEHTNGQDVATKPGIRCSCWEARRWWSSAPA